MSSFTTLSRRAVYVKQHLLSTNAERHIIEPRTSAFISGLFIVEVVFVSSSTKLSNLFKSICFLKRARTYTVTRKKPRFTVWSSEFNPLISLLSV